MSKDENGGLLSKVVKFVRNPTTSWADLDQQESDRESGYSKQMLKEMIKRKRRNDFVRKREFDMLRKMRRSEALSGADPAARPSFFQSSMPSRPDDRAMTLKKIDEIEAQMSMQWWKTKHVDSSVRTTSYPSSSALPSSQGPSQTGNTTSVPLEGQPSQAYIRTEPSPLSSEKAPPPVATTASARASVAMQPMPLPAVKSAPPPPSPAPQAPARIPLPGSTGLRASAPMAQDSTPGGFSSSKLFAMDVAEIAHDPELEEASIRFANGDDEGAEAGLLEVLAPHGSRVNHDETWLTLFDLYRATGQQEKFENAAIDFAGRFGRSAPQWFSMPEAVSRMKTAAAPAAAQASAQAADWTSPATFGTQTVAVLSAAVAKAPPPWRLSWAKLTTIEPGAVQPLTRLFTQWAAQPVQLRFIGAEVLEQVLQAATPSGDKSVDPAWWALRMEVLRVMHRPDEFELAALDYCVTYEVSPPSWESARCEYKVMQSDGTVPAGQTIIGEAFHDSLSLTTGTYGDTQSTGTPSHLAHVSTVELAGHIVGDAMEALDTLEQRLLGADVMVISCARLIRIDFSAAGSLLNWVTARQAEGRHVQFNDVHRLVSAFFNVIGISEHARVVPRTD